MLFEIEVNAYPKEYYTLELYDSKTVYLDDTLCVLSQGQISEYISDKLNKTVAALQKDPLVGHCEYVLEFLGWDTPSTIKEICTAYCNLISLKWLQCNIPADIIAQVCAYYKKPLDKEVYGQSLTQTFLKSYLGYAGNDKAKKEMLENFYNNQKFDSYYNEAELMAMITEQYVAFDYYYFKRAFKVNQATIINFITQGGTSYDC